MICSSLWKTQLLENATAILGGEAVAADERERIRELHAKIDELTVERNFSYGPSCVNWHSLAVADAFAPVPSPSRHDLLCSSPQSEPAVQISCNGLPRALSS